MSDRDKGMDRHLPSFADPEYMRPRPETEYETGIEIAPTAEPLEFLTAVYRSKAQPMTRRMRAAIEAAQYRHPRLAVTAQMNGEDFAAALDRAIERSNAVRTIDVTPSSALPEPDGTMPSGLSVVTDV